MNEFKEFQEIQERNNESLEARLEAESQELLKKADALIESSAELLAEGSSMTKEEIIERVQEESLKELGAGYSKEDFASIGTETKAYTPSFGRWSKYDSDIDYEISEVMRDVKAGRKIAVENGLNEIGDLQAKRVEAEIKKAEKAAEEKAEAVKRELEQKAEKEKKEAEKKAQEEKERIQKEKEAAEKKAAEEEEKKRLEEKKKLEEKIKKEEMIKAEEERKKKAAAAQK